MRRPKGKLALWELVAVVALVGLLGFVLLPGLARSREGARRAACQNNLKQMGIVFKMFAGEHRDTYPPLSRTPDNWMVDMTAIYPEYLSDLAVLTCPSSPLAGPNTFMLRRNLEHPGAQVGTRHPDCVSSLFYIYTGYMVFSDEQADALFDAYTENPSELLDLKHLNLDTPIWADSDRIAFTGQSGIPIMWDRVFVDDAFSGHWPLGANVLHMDGHVEFVRYSCYNNSNFFPVTRLSAETFSSTLPRLSNDCYDAGIL